jgi:hypothetical protein
MPPPGPPGGMPPPGGAGGAGLTPSPFSDLSTRMSHAYQLLDAGARTFKMAIDTGGFYKTPAVLAAVRKLEADARKIISSYAREGDSETPQRASVDETYEAGDVEGELPPVAESGE